MRVNATNHPRIGPWPLKLESRQMDRPQSSHLFAPFIFEQLNLFGHIVFFPQTLFPNFIFLQNSHFSEKCLRPVVDDLVRKVKTHSL